VTAAIDIRRLSYAFGSHVDDLTLAVEPGGCVRGGPDRTTRALNALRRRPWRT
jgi:hypothetical protein